MTAKLTAALLITIYLGAGLCFANVCEIGNATPLPKNLAQWTEPVHRDDPRPFWVRLLLSIRYDFLNRDIRGGATF